MAASATPWSKATVSQAVTPPESAVENEALREAAGSVGPVAHVVVWVAVGVIGVLLVVALQHVSWFGSPASGPGDQRAHAADPVARAVRGIAVGAVVDNDGHTLRVRGLAGGMTAVHIGARTSTHVFPGVQAADIAPGSMVMVYGGEGADGSVAATLIVGLSLPG
ncbi:hypothetical protein [Nocardia nova]|uniref:hypothetical protein n=1 Tax=Nocardia nova TaxID=37330 RepID=UPI0033C13FDC